MIIVLVDPPPTININAQGVTAVNRRLNAKWNADAMQDLRAMHGIDISDMVYQAGMYDDEFESIENMNFEALRNYLYEIFAFITEKPDMINAITKWTRANKFQYKSDEIYDILLGLDIIREEIRG